MPQSFQQPERKPETPPAMEAATTPEPEAVEPENPDKAVIGKTKAKGSAK